MASPSACAAPETPTPPSRSRRPPSTLHSLITTPGDSSGRRSLQLDAPPDGETALELDRSGGAAEGQVRVPRDAEFEWPDIRRRSHPVAAGGRGVRVTIAPVCGCVP